jgi:hypothetical protein
VPFVGSPAPKPTPAPEPRVALRERLTGTWQVDAGVRADRPLTEWETTGFRFHFDPSGVLTVHRGQVREQRVFTWSIDAAPSPPVLVWTPTDGNPAGAVRVAVELREEELTLSWDEPRTTRGARGPVAPATCRVTLSKVAAPAVAGAPVVAPAPQNVVGSRLAGTWEADRELTAKLGQGGAAATRLTFVSDPAVAGEVPDAYRGLFAGKRVYLAGRMTVGTAAYRFLLVEHHGNALLVYIVPSGRDEWACEEAVTVTLAPGADREKDLLFLTPLETARYAPAGGFRRAATRP